MRFRLFLLLTFITASFSSFAQHNLSGRVADAQTGQGIPFATIKWGAGSSGDVADVNGFFRVIIPQEERMLTVQSLGYATRQVVLESAAPKLLVIALTAAPASLSEVIVKPQTEKIRRILSAAIARRDEHNPDKFPWYRCHVYYRMQADVVLPDSLQKETAKAARFFHDQHLLLTETYSIRTGQRPQGLQEDVMATRFSGLRGSEFTSLVTDILPFHSYNDFITVNAKDYHNPVSPGWAQHYRYHISDEIVNGGDTIWVMRFRPRNGQQELEGNVYIHSGSYAISRLLATAVDTVLHRTVRLEQQYAVTAGRWFPQQLNYIFDWQLKSTGAPYTMHMIGTSLIDSVCFNKDPGFHFDKTHTVRLDAAAVGASDSTWASLRPIPLDKKDARTYTFMDSISTAFHFDKYMAYVPKLLEGKFPLGLVDLDLERLYTYNAWEKTRLGLGLQTSEKLMRSLSVGAWAGYGFGDKAWKWGAFTEFYADRYKEKTLRIAYDNDLRDPGRLILHPDLDKTYLRSFLMERVDKVKAASVTANIRSGYLSTALSVRHETITPQYDYALEQGGAFHQNFVANEASLALRYVYGMRTAPAFGHYYDGVQHKYPALYARITAGMLEGQAQPYYQLLLAADWQHHISRIGREHVRVMGGKILSDDVLPLSKLYAGNGFRGFQNGLYVFGTMLTMRPYEYYSDRFVNLYWEHGFDWKFYRATISGTGLSSAPSLSLHYNALWGALDHPEAQRGVAFSVPDAGYHETGAMLQNVLRLAYLNLYYITLNAGYFYHLVPGGFDAGKNGIMAFGLGVEL